MKTTLATNQLRVSAAQSYRRARNCLIHATLSPHCAAAELRSAAYWRDSARYWRSQAEMDAQPPVIAEARTWVSVRLETWDAELAEMLTSPTAISAEVE